MFDEVKNLMVETLNLNDDDVTLEANLRDDLGIDSIDAAELVMELEDHFDIKIEGDESAKFLLVSDVVNFVEAAKN